jgi:hypothetical protein
VVSARDDFAAGESTLPSGAASKTDELRAKLAVVVEVAREVRG